jgi:hypothetical protein
MKRVAVLLCALVGSWALIGQEPSPKYTRDEMEKFLQDAKIVSIRELSVGVTNSRKAKLSDGTLNHDAHVQSVDIFKASFATAKGNELNFKDTYKFNIAAYRLDKIMDLGMIPPSVERKVDGKNCAVTWWVNDTWMTEEERVKQNLQPPNPAAWNQQMYVVRVFDQLIFNTDRNLGNLVIDKQWNAWMIDHTRAFRMTEKLPTLRNLPQCERKLLAAMRKLDEGTLNEELKPYVNKAEIKAMLTRRDMIVKYFDEQIAAKGEAAVLYDLPPR